MDNCWTAVGQLLDSCWTTVGKLLDNSVGHQSKIRAGLDFGQRTSPVTARKSPILFHASQPLLSKCSHRELCRRWGQREITLLCRARWSLPPGKLPHTSKQGGNTYSSKTTALLPMPAFESSLQNVSRNPCGLVWCLRENRPTNSFFTTSPLPLTHT